MLLCELCYKVIWKMDGAVLNFKCKKCTYKTIRNLSTNIKYSMYTLVYHKSYLQNSYHVHKTGATRAAMRILHTQKI